MPPPLKYAKAVKLNRKELTGVIDSFAKEGFSGGIAAWRKACAKGVRNGKLDEASVDDCIAYVCQEVKARVEDNDADDNDADAAEISPGELRKMPAQMKKHAEKFV